MKKNIINALSGEKNKRLNSKTPTNQEYTAAWSDVDEIVPHSEVTVPSESQVEHAKEWVDNGSRL